MTPTQIEKMKSTGKITEYRKSNEYYDFIQKECELSKEAQIGSQTLYEYFVTLFEAKYGCKCMITEDYLIGTLIFHNLVEEQRSRSGDLLIGIKLKDKTEPIKHNEPIIIDRIPIKPEYILGEL